jgi:hypothetical protein
LPECRCVQKPTHAYDRQTTIFGTFTRFPQLTGKEDAKERTRLPSLLIYRTCGAVLGDGLAYHAFSSPPGCFTIQIWVFLAETVSGRWSECDNTMPAKLQETTQSPHEKQIDQKEIVFRSRGT